MGFDTWLEQDIRTFLDTEVSSESTPVITRLEDSAAISSVHDWKKEIEERLKQGDDAGAKQLFSQLRLKYLGTPKSHEEERTQVYKLMQECYVLIANHVLGDARTRELLRRMESGPTNIFDANVKSVDLSAPQERVQDSLPEIPQLTTAATAHLEPFAAMKETEDFTLPEKDHELFSFEPESLAKAATIALKKAKQVAPTPVAKITPQAPPRTVETPAVKQVPAPTAPPPSPEVAAKPVPPSTDPAATTLQTAMALALKEPRKAYDLLLPLTTPSTPIEFREPAQRLLEALKPHVSVSSVDAKPARELSPRERALGTARATAAAYQRTVRGVDDALALAGAFARARKKDDSEHALERAKKQIEELEQQYPSAAALLRERFERVRNMLHATSPRSALAPAPVVSTTVGTHESILTAAVAARKALLTRDRSALITAIVTLENLARTLPEEQRNLISATVTTMRQRIHTSP